MPDGYSIAGFYGKLDVGYFIKTLGFILMYTGIKPVVEEPIEESDIGEYGEQDFERSDTNERLRDAGYNNYDSMMQYYQNPRTQ